MPMPPLVAVPPRARRRGLRLGRPKPRPAAVARLCAAAVLLGCLPVGSAAAAPDARSDSSSEGSTTTTSADDLERRWEEAVRGVDAARADYEAQESKLTQALDRLAQAFTLSTGADRSAEDAAAALAARRAGRSRLVRGIYVAGGPAAFTAAAMTAPDPETAVWRIGADRRLLAVALAVSAREVRSSQEVAASAARRRELAQEDADRSARLLEQVRADGARAQESLEKAQALLAEIAKDRQEQARRRQEAEALARRLAEAQAAAEAARADALTSVSAAGIPTAYLLDYRAAAAGCPGMTWTLLAGVGQVESGHGRNNGPSSAGAIGPMQFMPRTFDAYAVDGNGDGVTDAWNPTDAIFTAAAYLCASGAGKGPAGVHRALLAYNHAEWYVQLVLAAQAAIARRFAEDAG